MKTLSNSMNIALIFAGGVGKRMNIDSLPKQFLVLRGKQILIRTLERFQDHPLIDSIVLVCKSDYISQVEKLIKIYGLNKVAGIVEGGSTGQQSIFKGLKETAKLFPSDSLVLIHDGVRPFIDKETISLNIECARKNGNAVTVAPSIETVVVVDGKRGNIRNLCTKGG